MLHLETINQENNKWLSVIIVLSSNSRWKTNLVVMSFREWSRHSNHTVPLSKLGACLVCFTFMSLVMFDRIFARISFLFV